MSRPPAGRLGAAVVLLGTAISLTGIMWDVQWHVDVGPDTFFTLSHLLLYSGSAISGIAAAVMVLRATAAQRAGNRLDRAAGGPAIRVFGVFAAPVGYLVAGSGAALFLLYGLLDLWWHEVYGFDAVLGSPPHVALFSSITITMVGAVIIYAYVGDRGWGRAGLALALPILMTFSPLTTNAFDGLPLPFDAGTAGTVLCCLLALLLGAAVVGRPGYTLGVAAALGVMQAFFWWFAPWASHAYAAAEGLPLRDDLTDRAPTLPSLSPMFLLAAAAVVEIILWYGRSTARSPRWLPQVAGAVAGLVLGVSINLQYLLIGSRPFRAETLIWDAALGLLLGALGAFLGYRFASMLRAATPVPTPAARRLAVQGGLA